MLYYTIVGSRETPEHAYEILKKISYYMARKGWTGRSGVADGADSALEQGVRELNPNLMEVYLPWDGFNSRKASDIGYIDTPKLPTYKEALEIAEHAHPAWDKCSKGVRALHTRNVYQVLGMDLKTPSKLLVCWAIPTKTGVKGGTNTAVQLAKTHGVSVLNIHNMKWEAVVDRMKILLHT